MPRPSDKRGDWERLIGLGEESLSKSYYPELSQRLADLEHFRSLLDEASDLFLLVRVDDGLLADCNLAAARRLGYEPGELCGMDMERLFDSGTGAALRRIVAAEDEVKREGLFSRFARKDGTWIPVEMSLHVKPRGRERFALIVARDITERLRVEEALRRAEEKYRSIFENALEGIFQTTSEGFFVSVNPAMARMLGYDTPRDLMNRITDIRTQFYVNPKRRDELLALLELNDQVQDFEIQCFRKDGSTMWASMYVRAVRDTKDRLVMLEGTFTDVTLRKQAETDLADLNQRLERMVEERTRELEAKAEELAGANRRLRELDEMKSAFLSSVSHELRTPLTSILGFAKLIDKDFVRTFWPLTLEHPETGARGKRILTNIEIIELEAARLTRLINDVLDLTRIESGKTAWNDQWTGIESLVDDAIRAVRPHLDQRPDLELLVETEPDLPALWTDPDRLVQVLINLVGNAVKFTESGRITVTVKTLQAGLVQFRVRDTGPGIPPEHLENIFENFHQVRQEDNLKEKPQGTGLGLPICRQIVEHYGGRLWAESEPGKGSTFAFTLPLGPDMQETGTFGQDSGRHSPIS
jgi:PAS domain S-box-containing protein